MTNAPDQQVKVLEQHLAAYPGSPLFAQLASYYLAEGKTREALTLCDNGLAYHPLYTTGHLVKAKVLAALHMYAEARRELELVKEFFPTNRVVNDLLTSLPETEEVSFAPTEASQASTPEPESEREILSESSFTPSPTEETAVETPAVEEPASPFDQLHTMVPPENIGQPSSDILAAESPEDAFSQLQATETPAAETSSTDPFGVGTQSPEEASGGIEAFQQLAEPAIPPGETTQQQEESPFAAHFPEEPPFPFTDTQQEEPPTAATPPVGGFPEEESFDHYAQRMRLELAGSENTMNIEEYLGTQAETQTETSSPFEAPPLSTEPPAPEKTKSEIEEIAEKLQGARKITPIINLADKTPHTVSEAETPASTGFVTPTLAEIYAKQGWYDDAIKAYRTLIITKPAERERFEKRIKELEELKAQASGGS